MKSTNDAALQVQSHAAFTISQKLLKNITADLRSVTRRGMMLLSVQRYTYIERGLLVAQGTQETNVGAWGLTLTANVEMADLGIGGMCVIDADALYRAVSKFAGDLTVAICGEYLTVTDGLATVRVDYAPIYEIERYMPYPAHGNGGPVTTCEAGYLADLLDCVLYAGATDESRPILCNVYMQIGESGAYYAVCADSFRAALWGEPVENAAFDGMMNIEALKVLHKLIKSDKGQVTLYTHGDYAVWVCGGGAVTIKLADGTYPNVEMLIPESVTVKALLAKSLTSRLNALSPFAAECAQSLWFDADAADNSVLHLWTDGGRVTASVGVRGGGAVEEMCLNLMHLLDFAKRVHGIMRMEVKNPQSAVLVRDDERPVRGLLMPMHIHR